MFHFVTISLLLNFIREILINNDDWLKVGTQATESAASGWKVRKNDGNLAKFIRIHSASDSLAMASITDMTTLICFSSKYFVLSNVTQRRGF